VIVLAVAVLALLFIIASALLLTSHQQHQVAQEAVRPGNCVGSTRTSRRACFFNSVATVVGGNGIPARAVGNSGELCTLCEPMILPGLNQAGHLPPSSFAVRTWSIV